MQAAEMGHREPPQPTEKRHNTSANTPESFNNKIAEWFPYRREARATAERLFSGWVPSVASRDDVAKVRAMFWCAESHNRAALIANIKYESTNAKAADVLRDICRNLHEPLFPVGQKVNFYDIESQNIISGTVSGFDDERGEVLVGTDETGSKTHYVLESDLATFNPQEQHFDNSIAA